MNDPDVPTLGPAEEPVDLTETPAPGSPPGLSDRVSQLFLGALAVLLLGYMFLGRGFAHVGIPPLYVGEVVLALGLFAAAWAIVRLGTRVRPSPIVWLLLAFMVLGLARTLPYLGQYGVDALRDAVLWGYGLFALMIYVLADRRVIAAAMRGYGWVIPIFAIWLPIAWTIAAELETAIDPTRPGEVVPLVFFKSGDMAVHIIGSIAYLVFCTGVVVAARASLWRTLIAVPLIWTALVGATTNRGSFVAAAIASVVALIIGRRWRTWMPVLAATAVAGLIFILPGTIPGVGQSPSVAPPTPVASVGASARASPTPAATPSPEPEPEASPGRQVGIGQLIENIRSIFVPSTDPGLSGTRAFRIAWWFEIVDYTAFGPYFWDGKGFGVNLATDDGFQPTADESLRAPHNSHMTALARMGVPGFLLWAVLQGVFGVGLLRAVRAHRREGDRLLAAAGAWILVYWVVIMANTSFDPYIEGPQGGIWFWTLFGFGLVVMRLRPQSSAR